MKFSLALLCFANLLLFLAALLLNNLGKHQLILNHHNCHNCHHDLNHHHDQNHHPTHILAKLDLNGGAGVNRTRSTGCVRNGDADIGLHLMSFFIIIIFIIHYHCDIKNVETSAQVVIGTVRQASVSTFLHSSFVDSCTSIYIEDGENGDDEDNHDEDNHNDDRCC